MALSPEKRAFVQGFIDSDGSLSEALRAQKDPLKIEAQGGNIDPALPVRIADDITTYRQENKLLNYYEEIDETTGLSNQDVKIAQTHAETRNINTALRRVFGQSVPAGYKEKLLASQHYVRHTNKIVRELERDALLKAQQVLLELAYVAQSDIRNVVDDDGVPKALQDLDTATARAVQSVEIVRRLGPKNEDGTNVVEWLYKYKFWDKLQALDKLAKHLGILADRPEIDPLTLSDQERKREMRRMILAELGDMAKPTPATIEQDGSDA